MLLSIRYVRTAFPVLFRKSMIYPLELQFTAKFFGIRIFRRLHFSDQYGIINASVSYISKVLAHAQIKDLLRAYRTIIPQRFAYVV